MKALAILLVCLATVSAVDLADLGSLARYGRTIPVHIPTQSVDSNSTFEVPSWLGFFDVDVSLNSIWTLPLTAANGGQTYPGEFLIIRNNGPGSITLYPQSPELLDGGASYIILPGTVAEFLSGSDWALVTASNGQGLQNIYMFDGYDETTTSSAFTIEIGPDTYNPPPYDTCRTNNCSNWQVVSIGSRAGQSNTGYRVNNLGYAAGASNIGIETNNFGYTAGANNTGDNVNNIGSIAGRNNTGAHVNNLGAGSGQYNIAGHVNNIGRLTGQYNTGLSVNNLGASAGQYNIGNNVNNMGSTAGQYGTGGNVNNLGSNAGQNNTGTNINNMGADAGRYGSGTSVNNLGNIAGRYNTGSNVNNFGPQAGQYNTGSSVNNMGNQAGQNNTGSFCSHDGLQAGSLNTFDYCYTNGRTSSCTAANQFVFGASAYPLHLRLPSDTGSYCTGATYDTCLNRGRTGAFTLGTGQDMYTDGYFCAGSGCTSSAPVAASTGLYDSNTRVVRSCTAGTGITCSVTDGVLTVTATSGLQEVQQKRIDYLETKLAELTQLVASLQR